MVDQSRSAPPPALTRTCRDCMSDCAWLFAPIGRWLTPLAHRQLRTVVVGLTNTSLTRICWTVLHAGGTSRGYELSGWLGRG
ncbi:MAG: hypothetical protein K0Q60_3930 [Microvirga sp.]|jgi:hypothetical protein|nr:hypothetical protein [Microvirga sp.]